MGPIREGTDGRWWSEPPNLVQEPAGATYTPHDGARMVAALTGQGCVEHYQGLIQWQVPYPGEGRIAVRACFDNGFGQARTYAEGDTLPEALHNLGVVIEEHHAKQTTK